MSFWFYLAFDFWGKFLLVAIFALSRYSNCHKIGYAPRRNKKANVRGKIKCSWFPRKQISAQQWKKNEGEVNVRKMKR